MNETLWKSEGSWGKNCPRHWRHRVVLTGSGDVPAYMRLMGKIWAGLLKNSASIARRAAICASPCQIHNMDNQGAICYCAQELENEAHICRPHAKCPLLLGWRPSSRTGRALNVWTAIKRGYKGRAHTGFSHNPLGSPTSCISRHEGKKEGITWLPPPNLGVMNLIITRS